MSFSVTFKVGPTESVKEAFEAADIPNKEAAVEAGGELLQSALHIANDLALEVSRPDEESAQVSISGHWNGGYDPKGGWAANMLTISVTQIYNPES
jgi:hypothetical protein